MGLGDPSKAWSPANPDGYFFPVLVERQAGAPVYAPEAPLDKVLKFFSEHPGALITPDAQAKLNQAAHEAYKEPTPLANAGANVGTFLKVIGSGAKEVGTGLLDSLVPKGNGGPDPNPKKTSAVWVWALAVLAITVAGVATYKAASEVL